MHNKRIGIFIDPGFRRLGVVVVRSTDDGLEFLDMRGIYLQDKYYKTMKVKFGSSVADALFMEDVIPYLDSLWTRFHPASIHVELPHGGQNFRSVKMLNMISGTLIGWASTRHLKINYYTPEANKKAATGDIHASKQLMEIAIRKKWPNEDWDAAPSLALEHIIDAAALVLVAHSRGNFNCKRLQSVR